MKKERLAARQMVPSDTTLSHYIDHSHCDPADNATIPSDPPVSTSNGNTSTISSPTAVTPSVPKSKIPRVNHRSKPHSSRSYHSPHSLQKIRLVRSCIASADLINIASSAQHTGSISKLTLSAQHTSKRHINDNPLSPTKQKYPGFPNFASYAVNSDSVTVQSIISVSTNSCPVSI